MGFPDTVIVELPLEAAEMVTRVCGNELARKRSPLSETAKRNLLHGHRLIVDEMRAARLAKQRVL